jgi:N-acetyl-gamma-glutamyl-phosphate reductase
MHFVSLAENAFAYNVDAHRHTPEIEQSLAELGFLEPVTFVPHLLPLDQGELVTCFVTPSRQIDPGELRSLYEERYADEPFVHLSDVPPGVRDVRDTNECRIHVVNNRAKVVALAAIDNLWKGASGQAVQNLNLMLGLDETEGLA